MRMPNGYGSVTKIKKKTRKPYWVRGPEEVNIDPSNNIITYSRKSLGYYATMEEALTILDSYYRQNNILKVNSITFKELYEKWSTEKYLTVKESSIYAYTSAFKASYKLYNMKVRDIQLCDLEQMIEESEKNYPTLKTIRLLYVQMFEFACMHNIIESNFARWISLDRYRDKNPNKQHRDRFSCEMVESIWNNYKSKNDATVLMLIYTGVRIGELLNLKKEDVYIENNYFNIIDSKTKNGIRTVPIAAKIKPFFIQWYDATENKSEYLLFNKDGKHYTYEKYRYDVYDPFLNDMDIHLSPHCCRHTLISMLADKHVSQTIIKKIVGHAGAMSLTERVYTHLNIQELIDAVNLL